MSGIDITLTPTRLATISGVAVDAQGRPMPTGYVSTVARGGMVGTGGVGGPLRPDGSFMIPNVPPGEYIVRADAPRQAPAPGTAMGPPEFSVAVVAVNGGDVTGIRLAPAVPVLVSGQVSFDDAAAAQSIRTASVRVSGQPLDLDDALGMSPGRCDERAAARGFHIRAENSGGAGGLAACSYPARPAHPRPWLVKSIRANGVDVTDAGVEVGGQGASGIDIEMTNRLQQVSGAVADAKGDRVKDYRGRGVPVGSQPLGRGHDTLLRNWPARRRRTVQGFDAAARRARYAVAARSSRRNGRTPRRSNVSAGRRQHSSSRRATRTLDLRLTVSP